VLHRPGSLTVLVFATLLLAGCGGDDESASESYANDVCAELSEWVASIDEAITSLTEAGLSADREDLAAAVEDATEATDELAEDLAELEPPETDDGERAKEELDGAVTGLRQQVGAISVAVDSDDDAGAVVTSITTRVSTGTTTVGSTFEDLEGLDTDGELGDAFRNSEACDSARERLADLGP
jgi:type IV pilus biogenesis protein CpaD/CtpE